MTSTPQRTPQSMPPKVFISYSHKDKRWLDDFKTQLAPFLRGAQIEAWDDTRINPGEDWKEAVEKALTSTDIGVLLVTPNFLASQFIAHNELPPLLAGKSIFWIAVSASGVEVTPIAKFQAANDPSRPLNILTPGKRAQEWVSICKKLSEAVEKRVAEQAEASASASPASPKTAIGPDALALSDSRLQRQPASNNAGKPIAEEENTTEVFWPYAKQLEGKTLYTEKRRNPFKVIRVTETSFVIGLGTGGSRRSYTRRAIEAGCHAGFNRSAVSTEILRQAGVTKREENLTYLPVIIREILRLATPAKAV